MRCANITRLICTFVAQLICALDFAIAKIAISMFSHEGAHVIEALRSLGLVIVLE